MPEYPGIPRSAYEAHRALTDHAGRTQRVNVDTRTHLVRDGANRINLVYRGWRLVRYYPNGDVRVMGPRIGDIGPPIWPFLDRIDAALPEFWRLDHRSTTSMGLRRRPRYTYRDTYTLDYGPLTFRADGGVQWSERDATDSLSIEAIEIEAASAAGFSTPASRRRAPRPAPAYTRRASVAPSGYDMFEPALSPERLQRLIRTLTPNWGLTPEPESVTVEVEVAQSPTGQPFLRRIRGLTDGGV